MDSFIGNTQRFCPCNRLYSRFSCFKRDLFKFESCASGLKSRNDFGYIIRNEAKSSICMVFLDNYIGKNILLLRANWATLVIISASSRIINFMFRLLRLILFTLKVLLCLKTFLSPNERRLCLFHHLRWAPLPYFWNLFCKVHEQLQQWLMFFLFQEVHRTVN